MEDELLLRTYLSKIRATAEAEPRRPAVYFSGNEITYSEFWQVIECVVATIRRDMDSGANGKILILGQPGPEFYASMMATLWAGGTYCPVSSDVSTHQIQEYLDRFNPSIVLVANSDSSFPEIREETERRGIGFQLVRQVVDDFFGAGAEFFDSSEKFGIDTENEVAYVIFTSGSTGKPKGVEITREGLSNYLRWIVRALPGQPGARALQFARTGFDLSVAEIFWPLLTGQTLYSCSSPAQRSFPAMFIADHALNSLIVVPSFIDQISREISATSIRSEFETVNLVMFCGEPLKLAQVEAARTFFPRATLLNTYGPTETTVSVTEYWIPMKSVPKHQNGVVCLGRPIQGVEIELMRSTSSESKEIIIKGPQVARGYLNQASPAFDILGGKKTFSTGDFGEVVGEDYFHKGRNDRQVKIRGYRVELDALEAAIQQYLGGSVAAVAVGSRLIAVCSSDDVQEGGMSTKIRERVKEKLGEHYIPEIVYMEGFPKNASGKTNYRELMARILGESAHD